MSGKYIWLFGENRGRTTNNNSYYFWKHVVNFRDEVAAYFIMEFSFSNLGKYLSMNRRERRFVLWRNSFGHFRLFHRADMFFVTLSYRDVAPERLFWKNLNSIITAPLIYLGHGAQGLKAATRPGDYADNCLLRNCLYTSAPDVIDGFLKNRMKRYQIDTFPIMPRWQELCRRILAAPPRSGGKRFLWFITWRERDAKHSGEAGCISAVRQVLSDDRLAGFFKDSGGSLEIVLHRQMRDSDIRDIREIAQRHNWCKLSLGSRMDVMQSIVDSDVLITDYSSLGFDFTAVGKPVIFFAGDLEEYSQYRDFVDPDGYMKCAVTAAGELTEKIVAGNYGINPYYNGRCSPITGQRMREVADGKAIGELYDSFLRLQRRSVAFIGYDFSGIGGTITATNAQAESLLEKAYSVRFYPLKQMYPHLGLAPGIPMRPMHRVWKAGRADRLASLFIRGKRFFSYLRYDHSRAFLPPVAGYNMTRLMRTIHADTVISTRESLHLFLLDARSPFIREKLYFFHCPSNLVGKIFPGCLEQLQKRGVGKALFVTERNRQALLKKGFDNYSGYRVIGNCLSSDRMVEKKDLVTRNTKTGVWLLRISSSRQPALERLLDYADYLKSREIYSFRFEIYGDGDRASWLKQNVARRELSDWIGCHAGVANIKEVISLHDFVIDFSESQSFGMPYIEAILNGKAVFAYDNEGAEDVLAEMPELIWRDFDELTAKLSGLDEFSAVEQLRRRYDLISKRFSRDAIASNLIEMFR